MRAADVKKAAWTLTRRKAWSGFTGLPNRMIDSEAFQAIRSVHAVKVLIYFWQMAVYAKEKRRPGQDSPVGNLKKIKNKDNISFEYRIAGYRGMRPDQFVRALRELFKFGFITITHHGRGIRGDWTKYALSDRWELYGTRQWEERPFPVADRVGWRSKKSYYANAELSTTQRRSYQVVKTANDYGIAELKTPISTDPVTTDFRSPSRYTIPVQLSPKDRGIDRAPHKRWQPPKSELRESVTEILRQRPDDRASDRRFVAMLTDILDGAGRERLDPARVYRDLQDRHGLDGWTTDLLFAVACIPPPEVRA